MTHISLYFGYDFVSSFTKLENPNKNEPFSVNSMSLEMYAQMEIKCVYIVRGRGVGVRKGEGPNQASVVITV